MEQKVKDIVYLLNSKLNTSVCAVWEVNLNRSWADIMSNGVIGVNPSFLEEMYCILYQVMFLLPMDFISVQDFY